MGKLDERCCGRFEHLLRIYIPFALHGVSEMITMFSAILESSPYLFSKRALLVLVKSYIRASLPLPSIHLFLSPSPFGAEVRLRTEPPTRTSACSRVELEGRQKCLVYSSVSEDETWMALTMEVYLSI